MKSTHGLLFILGLFLAGPGLAQQSALAGAGRPVSPNTAAVQDDRPAQQRIAAARIQLQVDPEKVQAYNELALAFLRRARETADSSYLKDADAALAEGLNLDATDFQLQKTQVALMLSRHEFVKARELASVLNHRIPDDVMTYGYLAEADIALGNYPGAETNAQWMMNLRPNNTPALLVGARLRTLYGDARGAIEFLNRAYSQTSPIEVEEQAWIANQIASIEIDSGQIEAAAQTLEQAEQIFPSYPYTIENLARVRTGQNRLNEAVQVWMQATRIDHDPHALYELAKAQEAVGQRKEARATYAEFEKLAGEPGSATDASRLDLILMYAGSPATAPDALRLAQREMAARQDVWTLDAYAWALYANEKLQDADAAVQKALADGIQSAQIWDHAGHIAMKLNHSADAARYFKLSVQSNPASEYADDALKSVNLAGATDDRKRNVSKRSPDRPQSAVPLEPLTASHRPDRDAASARAGMVKADPVFAPVQEAVLTPQPD